MFPIPGTGRSTMASLQSKTRAHADHAGLSLLLVAWNLPTLSSMEALPPTLSNSLSTALVVSRTTDAMVASHPRPSSISCITVALPARMPTHTSLRLATAPYSHPITLSMCSKEPSTSLLVTRRSLSRLSMSLDQHQSVSRSSMTSVGTPLVSTAQPLAETLSLTSTTPCLLLDTALRTEWTTGSLRTLGQQNGVIRASSRFREASTCVVLPCAILTQRQFRRSLQSKLSSFSELASA